MSHRPAPLPACEHERLEALRRYDILDTPPEDDFDRLATLAALLCETPIALVSLLDERRQWWKARCGVRLNETSRALAFCSHAILGTTILEVPDAALDERFARSPLVIGDAGIRFYAGVPLFTPDGFALGTLCVMDRRPRRLRSDQRKGLWLLAEQVVGLLEQRRQAQTLAGMVERLKRSPVATVGHEPRTPLTPARGALRLRAVPLAGAIERSLESVRSLADAAGVILETPATSEWVAADPDRLAQLLGNLVSNAVKLSPSGAAVAITAEPVGEGVEVRVTGRGSNFWLSLASAAVPLVDPFFAGSRAGDEQFVEAA